MDEKEIDMGLKETTIDFSYLENNEVVLTGEVVGPPSPVNASELLPGSKRGRKKKE